MRERLIGLRERRAKLRERAARERAALEGWVARAEAVENMAAPAVRAFEWLRERPIWIAAGVAILVALRPKGALRWLSRGFGAWQLWRQGHALWRRVAPLLAEPKRTA
jgi:hypothetical protein